jgi:1-pyrroline-5-carboxylate dehydrogenase
MQMITDTVLASRDFAGLHFTVQLMYLKIFGLKLELTFPLQNIPKNRRETGGKISSLLTQVPTQTSFYRIVRGAFEFQGQNVQQLQSLCTTKYVAVKEQIITDVKSMKMGSPEDFSNFITAVIHEGSFDKLASFIDQAKKDTDAEIIVGETTTNRLDTLLSSYCNDKPSLLNNGNRIIRTSYYFRLRRC